VDDSPAPREFVAFTAQV
jgi:hypothetical protein